MFAQRSKFAIAAAVIVAGLPIASDAQTAATTSRARPEPAARTDRTDRVDPSNVASQQPRCSARVHSVAPQRAHPDPTEAPSLVEVDDGALLVWRADDGTLFLTRLDASFERRADDREIARPAGAFAMIAAQHGAVLAFVEHLRNGDDAVLLARVGATGEARNVPRELGRQRTIEQITLAPTANGYAVAWSTPANQQGQSHLVITDARGVPTAPERAIAPVTAPRLAWLPGSQMLVLAASGGPGEPIVATIAPDGSLGPSSPWVPGARQLALGAGGSSVLTVTTSADPGAGGALAITRFAPDVGVSSSQVAYRLSSIARLSGFLAERAGAVFLVDEGARRESLIRLAPDGSLSLLAARTGTRGFLVPTSDGFVLTGLQPPTPTAAGLDVVILACPRPPPPPPLVAPPPVSANTPNAPPTTQSGATLPSDTSSAAPSTSHEP